MLTRLTLLLSVLTLAACGSGKAATPSDDTKPAVEPAAELSCNADEPVACDVEGMKFENAVGRPRSANSAARHYAAACEGGYGPGCTHLAAMFFEKEAFDQAHELYARACEAEDAEGCANLGFMESRAGNKERARELYGSACDRGSMGACENLADVYQSGRGVPTDHDKAQALFERACAGGSPSACIRLAWSLARDCKGEACAEAATDEKQAALITQKACNEGSDVSVCTGLGVHLESGRLLPKDAKRARELYDAGCEAGEAWACERLGVALSRGLGGPRDIGAAVAPLEKACSAEFASACSSLGAILLGGQGVERDEERGAELVGRACELHEARACNTMKLLGL